MSFTLMSLPFDKNDLTPYISAETIDFHYGRHHQTYINNLNQLITSTDFVKKSLIEIVKTSTGTIFNNAAQVWNHDFYWNSLCKRANTDYISRELMQIISVTFGGLENFKEAFTKEALGVFGSGWVWLVKDGKGLAIVATSNAATPITNEQKPLLTCDVWEHAYYIDYRNGRAKYLDAFWQLVNWQFVSENFNAS